MLYLWRCVAMIVVGTVTVVGAFRCLSLFACWWRVFVLLLGRSVVVCVLLCCSVGGMVPCELSWSVCVCDGVCCFIVMLMSGRVGLVESCPSMCSCVIVVVSAGVGGACTSPGVFRCHCWWLYCCRHRPRPGCMCGFCFRYCFRSSLL